MSKQPFYTALGWAVWQVGKRYARKRVTQAATSRRLLVAGALAAGAAGLALAFVESASAER